ncbi:hypothetical protein QTP88_022043 [Uroleucon formosanum]
MNKRKRIELECEECGSQFDDDYKARHEKAIHDGKNVKIKHVGAPLYPFEASKKKATVSVPDVPSTSVSTIIATQSSSLSFTTESSPNVKVDEKVDIEKPAETETSETMPEDESFSWMSCAGQVTAFLANFERASDILTNIKTVAVPNPRIFVIEIIDYLSKIHKECEELLHYARKGEKEILEENEKVVVTEN